MRWTRCENATKPIGAYREKSGGWVIALHGDGYHLFFLRERERHTICLPALSHSFAFFFFSHSLSVSVSLSSPPPAPLYLISDAPFGQPNDTIPYGADGVGF